MRLSVRRDIDVPIADAYAVFGDLDAWERDALRRGADVTRVDAPQGGTLSWIVSFLFRGKQRIVKVVRTVAHEPSHLAFAGEGQLFAGTAELALIDLSPRRTRAHLVLEIKPRTITARLVLQTLRLNKHSLQRKLDQRFGAVCADIELRRQRRR